MLTGQAPAHQVAANAMGGTNFFTHELRPDATPVYDPASGSGRRTVTIPLTDDMMAAAQTLERQLTRAQHNALFEAMIHIESMKLTVDADQTDDSKA